MIAISSYCYYATFWRRGDAKKIKKRVMYGAIWQIWVTAEFCPDLEQPFLKNATSLNRLELPFTIENVQQSYDAL